jgi:hypothetical protein
VSENVGPKVIVFGVPNPIVAAPDYPEELVPAMPEHAANAIAPITDKTNSNRWMELK